MLNEEKEYDMMTGRLLIKKQMVNKSYVDFASFWLESDYKK